MCLIKQIFEWIETLPCWIQDACRRLYENPSGLSDSDLEEIYKLLLKEHGLCDAELTSLTLESSRIPDFSQEHTLVLKSLGNLQHVNRIDPDQRLIFANKGMTIIYGGNGSGKSGYARIFKQSCFCRDIEEKVLPNVADGKENSTIPSAVFEIEYNGEPKKIVWEQNAACRCSELANVSVFDSKTARIALSSDQEVHYVPYGMGILTELGGTIFPRLKSLLEQEINSIDLSEKLFVNLKGNTRVGALVDKLDCTTLSDLQKLAALSEAEMERGRELSSILKNSDFGESIRAVNLAMARIQGVLNKICNASSLLSFDKIPSLARIQERLQKAKSTESLSASALNDNPDDELLQGTGGEEWKQMFMAAKKFVASNFKEENLISDQRMCPLCQQRILAKAKVRLQRFEEYISSEISAEACNAQREFDSELGRITNIVVSDFLNDALRIEFCEYNAEIAELYHSWCVSYEARRQDVCLAMRGQAPWDGLRKEDLRIVKALNDIIDLLRQRVETMRKAMLDANRDAVQSELDELRARVKLQRVLPDLELWFSRLNRRNHLRELLPLLNSSRITQKIKEISESAIVTPLRAAVAKELENLGVGLQLLRPGLTSKGRRGALVSSITLDVPNKQPISLVLSEGEQKAIAIASFLGEIDASGQRDAIVFDDPMTSLDHIRRRKVAKRLAQEALIRQVIIFSHEPIFVTRLVEECKRVSAECSVRSLSWTGSLCGIVSPGMAWQHKKYSERLEELRQEQRAIAKLCGDYPSPAVELRIRNAYANLRATIELIVQEVCLCGTLKRFEDYVDVKQLTRILPFEQESADKLYHLWGKCSDHFNGHDHASFANEGVPDSDELRQDIQLVQDCVQHITSIRSMARKANNR